MRIKTILLATVAATAMASQASAADCRGEIAAVKQYISENQAEVTESGTVKAQKADEAQAEQEREQAATQAKQERDQKSSEWKAAEQEAQQDQAKIEQDAASLPSNDVPEVKVDASASEEEKQAAEHEKVEALEGTKVAAGDAKKLTETRVGDTVRRDGTEDVSRTTAGVDSSNRTTAEISNPPTGTTTDQVTSDAVTTDSQSSDKAAVAVRAEAKMAADRMDVRPDDKAGTKSEEGGPIETVEAEVTAKDLTAKEAPAQAPTNASADAGSGEEVTMKMADGNTVALDTKTVKQDGGEMVVLESGETEPTENWFGRSPELQTVKEDLDEAEALLEQGKEEGCIEAVERAKVALGLMEPETSAQQ